MRCSTNSITLAPCSSNASASLPRRHVSVNSSGERGVATRLSRASVTVRFRTPLRWSANPWATLRAAGMAVLSDAQDAGGVEDVRVAPVDVPAPDAIHEGRDRQTHALDHLALQER